MTYHRGLLWLLPWLIPLAAVARPSKPSPRAAAPILVPVNTSWLEADGTTSVLSGTLTLQRGMVTPPIPPADTVVVTGLTVAPSSLLQGAGSVGTVTLNRAPLLSVQVLLKSDTLGLTISSPVTVDAGKTSATFPIGTASAPNRDMWYTLTASYNGTSKVASLLVRGTLGPPVPPVPGAANPAMTAFLNGDGSPIVGPLVYGQEVQIKGSAFGTTQGKVMWQGSTLTQILSWSDTLIRVKLPVPVFSGGTQFDLQRSDGVGVSSMVPLDGPGRVPGSAKRR